MNEYKLVWYSAVCHNEYNTIYPAGLNREWLKVERVETLG